MSNESQIKDRKWLHPQHFIHNNYKMQLVDVISVIRIGICFQCPLYILRPPPRASGKAGNRNPE